LSPPVKQITSCRDVRQMTLRVFSTECPII